MRLIYSELEIIVAFVFFYVTLRYFINTCVIFLLILNNKKIEYFNLAYLSQE
jgi:hypothetical protein